MQQSVQNQHRLDTPLQPPQALQRPGSVPIAVTTPSGTSTEASNVAHSTSSTRLGIARVKQRHRRAEQTRLHHPSSHSFAICAAWYYVAAGSAICCRCFQSWWWRWWPHQKTNGRHHLVRTLWHQICSCNVWKLWKKHPHLLLCMPV